MEKNEKEVQFFELRFIYVTLKERKKKKQCEENLKLRTPFIEKAIKVYTKKFQDFLALPFKDMNFIL